MRLNTGELRVHLLRANVLSTLSSAAQLWAVPSALRYLRETRTLSPRSEASDCYEASVLKLSSAVFPPMFLLTAQWLGIYRYSGGSLGRLRDEGLKTLPVDVSLATRHLITQLQRYWVLVARSNSDIGHAGKKSHPTWS